MSEMIALKVDALTRLTYAAAPGFVERGGGTIINIASVVALAPWIVNGVYGASKAFVLAFSRSLRHELAEKGVRVQVVLPGVHEQAQAVFLYGRKCRTMGDDTHRRVGSCELGCDRTANGAGADAVLR
jgi:NADP-dependent 3-hydroxy acid dehydrogenase YdfG